MRETVKLVKNSLEKNLADGVRLVGDYESKNGGVFYFDFITLNSLGLTDLVISFIQDKNGVRICGIHQINGIISGWDISKLNRVVNELDEIKGELYEND